MVDYEERIEEREEEKKNTLDKIIPTLSARTIGITFLVFAAVYWLFMQQTNINKNQTAIILFAALAIVLYLMGRGENEGMREKNTELDAIKITEDSIGLKKVRGQIVVGGKSIEGDFKIGKTRLVEEEFLKEWRVGFLVEDRESKKPYYFLAYVSYFKDDVGMKGYKMLDSEYKGEDHYIQYIPFYDPQHTEAAKKYFEKHT